MKKSRLYRELWYFYYHCFVYKKPHEYWGYVRNRFWARGKIRAIKPIIAAEDSSYSIHLLCSHRDVDMLLWALASWYRVVPVSGKVYIHEDGSFTEEDRSVIARILPAVEIVDFEWAMAQVKLWLAQAPSALKMREEYKKHILIVKLIDPQFVSQAPKRLIIDTDILWFKRPEELLQVLQRGGATMQYGDSTVPVNSGIVAYPMSRIGIGDLETYCKEEAPHKQSHFVEQDGYAFVLGRSGEVAFLNRELYVVRADVSAAVVAKHFTGPRREDFWREGVETLCASLT